MMLRKKNNRVFLYKEDLNKFSKAFTKAIDHMKTELMPDYDFTKFDKNEDYKEEENEKVENTENKEKLKK